MTFGTLIGKIWTLLLVLCLQCPQQFRYKIACSNVNISLTAHWPFTSGSGSKQELFAWPSSGNWAQSVSSGHCNPTIPSTDSHRSLEFLHKDLIHIRTVISVYYITLWRPTHTQTDTDWPAGRHSLLWYRVTHGHEHCTRKEHEIFEAVCLNERRKERGLPAHRRLLLRVMTQIVGEAGGVIGQIHADLQRDGLTATWHTHTHTSVSNINVSLMCVFTRH